MSALEPLLLPVPDLMVTRFELAAMRMAMEEPEVEPLESPFPEHRSGGWLKGLVEAAQDMLQVRTVPSVLSSHGPEGAADDSAQKPLETADSQKTGNCKEVEEVAATPEAVPTAETAASSAEPSDVLERLPGTGEGKNQETAPRTPRQSWASEEEGPLTERVSRQHAVASRQAGRRLRTARYLREALEDGDRAVAVRAALSACREAGCEESHAALLAKAQRVLPLIEALEEAMESGGLVELRRAVSAAVTGGATTHATAAREELHRRESMAAAEESLATAKTAVALEAALFRAREAGVHRLTLEHYEAKMQEMRTKEAIKSAESAFNEEPSAASLGRAKIAVSRARFVVGNHPDIERLEERLEELETRVASAGAKQDLENATCVEDLEWAISRARDLGFPSKDLEHYQARLMEGALRNAVEAQLEDAKTPEQLAAATARAREVGVPAQTVKVYEERLRRQNEAIRELDAAVASGCCERMRSALEVGQHAGLGRSQLASAEQAFAALTLRTKLQNELRSCCVELETSLESTPDVGDAVVSRLKAVMEAALEAGVSYKEIVLCETMLRDHERKRLALVEIHAALTEVEGMDLRAADMEILMLARTRLQVAVAEAIEAGLPESKLSEAERGRRRVHNAVQDRKGVVRVFCRVRPLVPLEVSKHEREVVCLKDGFTVEVDGALNAFDAAWAPGEQEDVFEDTQDLVQSAVDGFNATIFAYGQTGAGKTFTMYGQAKPPALRGICPRAADEVFRIIERDQSRCTFKVTFSMLELYCRHFFDLLGGGPEKEKPPQIRVTRTGEVLIENVLEQVVYNADDVQCLIKVALRDRHSRDTQMNAGSSRSHLLFIMKISSVVRETGEQRTGKMLLVDLAGSERVKRSEVFGEGLKEAIEINRSLTALGDVIEALTRGGAGAHIPYRNHELTQIMQDSLGGTAKTLMFVNLSPAASSKEESVMSLKYAQRARGIVNKPAAPNSSLSVPPSSRSRGSTPNVTPRRTPRRSDTAGRSSTNTNMSPQEQELLARAFGGHSSRHRRTA